MKKKLWLVLLALASALCLCFGLAACGEKPAKPSEGSETQHTFTADNVCPDCGEKWEYTDGLEYELDGDTYTVTGIGTASGDIVIPYGHEGKFVTKIADEAFKGSEAITGIYIPEKIVSVGRVAFAECPNLVSATWDAADCTKAGVTMDEAMNDDFWETMDPEDYIVFANSGLKAITIGERVKKIPEYAFAMCNEITSITIPKGVTSIGLEAFVECEALETVQWNAENFTTPVFDDFYISPFSECENLQAVIFGDNVINISSYSFCDCWPLTSIELGKNVTNVGECAFSGCSSLTDIQFKGTVKEWQAIQKGEDWNGNTGEYTVTCTDGKITKLEETADAYGGLYFNMPEGGFDTTTPVTITFYHVMGSKLQNILETYIEKFRELYPNITVEHQFQGSYSDLKKAITTRIQAGWPPDLAICYPEHVAGYAISGAVQPLDDFLADGAYRDLKVKQADGTEVPLNMTAQEQANFIEAFWDAGKQLGDENIRYMLPYAMSPDVLYYNKTFFDENSLTVPTTWDEMETVSARIKEITNNAPKNVAFGYDNEINLFINMCAQSGASYLSATGEHYLFDNPTAHAFVERIKGWYDEEYFTTGALSGVDYTSSLFTEEKCYMSIDSCAEATYNLPYSNAFEVGVAPLPQIDPAHPQNYVTGQSLCLFKNEDPQRTLASWLFLKFLTTNADYQAEISAEIGYMPVLKENVMRTNAGYAALLDGANSTTNILALAIATAYKQVSSYFTPPAFYGSDCAQEQVGLLIQSVLTNQKTIDEAFADAIEVCKKRYG